MSDCALLRGAAAARGAEGNSPRFILMNCAAARVAQSGPGHSPRSPLVTGRNALKLSRDLRPSAVIPFAGGTSS